MNQAELIHLGCTNCDPKGLLLYEVAEFDIRDLILLQGGIKEFEYTHRSYGRGTSLHAIDAIRAKRIEVQKKTVLRKGKELTMLLEQVSARKRSFKETEGGCNLPKKVN